MLDVVIKTSRVTECYKDRWLARLSGDISEYPEAIVIINVCVCVFEM